MLTQDEYLSALEAAHRARCGTERRFCYVETTLAHDTCIISIVEEDEPGHFPVSEDQFLGTRREMRVQATRLNRERLGLGPDEAALIIASSMSGDVERRRRR